MMMMIPDSAGKNLEESGDLPLEPLKWSFGNSTLLQNPQRTKALKHFKAFLHAKSKLKPVPSPPLVRVLDIHMVHVPGCGNYSGDTPILDTLSPRTESCYRSGRKAKAII